jgi:RHS repeat-associated protein
VFGALEVHYYPFGLEMPTLSKQGSPNHDYTYNGKELQKEFGLDWHDYGARMYDPTLGRWNVVDPAADLLERSSPYVYALNSPIVYLDLDGELPILINGRVGSDSERGDKSYWDNEIIATIKGSGVANPGGEFHFVDGDQTYSSNPRFRGLKKTPSMVVSAPSLRRSAGEVQASQDFEKILSKLERDPESRKIIEKIQIYTHSRGGAFGEGYTAKLLELISENSGMFADPNHVIDFVINLASHQGSYINALGNVPTVSISHDTDPISEAAVNGGLNIESKAGETRTNHENKTFTKELEIIISSFLNGSDSDSYQVIDLIDKFRRAGIVINFIE